MSRILVTGGTGFIGSHTIVELINQGHEVVSVDSLINSYDDVLDGIEQITGLRVINHCLDLSDSEPISTLCKEEGPFDGIIHFAALKAVGESMEKPFLYYRNNINSTINILEAAVEAGIPNFIFSSSCTVYGKCEHLPVTEDTPWNRHESPYGLTKQMGEMFLQDITRKFGLNALALRYFNPAGAHPSLMIGERPKYAAYNLVPVMVEVAQGQRDQLVIYGDDYPTRDGTCIRDYIHVVDIARAHVMAMDHLLQFTARGHFDAFNLGIGEGMSVKEAVDAFESANRLSLNKRVDNRRPGDVPAVYADFEKARRILGWQPQYSLQDIMSTAWLWGQKMNQHS